MFTVQRYNYCYIKVTVGLCYAVTTKDMVVEPQNRGEGATNGSH